MDNRDLVDAKELKCMLRRVIYRSPESRFIHRMYCVLLVKEGCSYRDIAGFFGEHPRTVERWVHKFEDKRIEGLQGSKHQGRHASLSETQYNALKDDLFCSPRVLGYQCEKWGGKEFSTHIEQRYGIQLGIRQCQRLLKQLRAD